MGSINTYDPTTGQLRRIVGDDNHLRDEMVAEYESTSTATHAYEVGGQFIYNGKLYEATSAISIGGTIITEGANANCIESDSLTEQIAKKGSADNFIGTKQQWAALTPEEQAKYNTMDFLGDSSSGGGGLNPDIVAPTEYSPSLHSYVVGDQLIYNNKLYTVKIPIAIGNTLSTEGEIYNAWVEETWGGTYDPEGKYVWTDGDNIYYSNYQDQRIFDKTTSTWSNITWVGNLPTYGNGVWTDGENIYYTGGDSLDQYVFDKTTSTWNDKTWSGFKPLFGDYIWTDGENIYYSDGYNFYVLDKTTSTWNQKTWSGVSNLDGAYIWSDNDNIYYSKNSDQYVLDKTTSTWVAKTWTGLSNIDGRNVWTDGEDIYYSASSNQYILDKATSTWTQKTWAGLSNVDGQNIWTDGENIYYSDGLSSYRLIKSGGNIQPSPTIVKQIESSGHTIVDEEGTELIQRSKLQFTGATVSDDETNDATVVETVNPVEYEEDIHGVNLIPYPYKDGNTKTKNGITFSCDTNGIITANGTATGTGDYIFTDTGAYSSLVKFKNGSSYTLSGCPNNGSAQSYYIRAKIYQNDINNIYKTINDYGSGVNIEIPNDSNVYYAHIYIHVLTGQTVTNLTFKPMLRKATIQDDAYRPFNQQSIQNQLTDQINVLGAKNLIPINFQSETKNGVTTTANGDGTYTLNGTNTGTGSIWYTVCVLTTLIPGETYILSGTPVNDSARMFFRNDPDVAPKLYVSCDKDGIEKRFTIPDTYSATQRWILFINVPQGATVTNLIFKPMLRLASDPDKTFVPYAPTNRNLAPVVGSVIPSAGVSVLLKTLMRQGAMVNMCYNITTSQNITAGTLLGTIPSGFRPAYNTFYAVVDFTNTKPILGTVRASGDVVARTDIASNTNIGFYVSWSTI